MHIGICVVAYCVTIVLVTLLHFGSNAVRFYADKNAHARLRGMFNRRVTSLHSAEEKRCYMLLRKVIQHQDYFRHLDIPKYIERCDSDAHDTLSEELRRLKIREKKIFLFYSASYNAGIFFPAFMPVLVHILRLCICTMKVRKRKPA